MINGVTKLVVTKMDVLNDFDSFKAAETYILNGEQSKNIPFDLDVKGLEMGYKTIDGWGMLDGVNSYADSPSAFKNYISYLSKELEVPVSLISVGPERNQLLEI